MENMILELPYLTTLKLKEDLYVYMAVAKDAMSTILQVERGGNQVLGHYVSRTLHEAEHNYAPIEKLALLNSSRGSKGTSKPIHKSHYQSIHQTYIKQTRSIREVGKIHNKIGSLQHNIHIQECSKRPNPSRFLNRNSSRH